jgi:tetratricopeptide (TPR) repeat protein
LTLRKFGRCGAMMRLPFCLLFALFCTTLLYGFEDQFLREPVREGIQAIYDLDYAKAQKIFDQLKKDYPENPVGYGMTAIRAWHELLFTSRNLAIYQYGIPTPFDDIKKDSKRSISLEEKQFLEANKTLQDFCEKLLKINPKDPLALYFKGVSYENLSTQALTLDGAFFRSISYAKDAAKSNEQVLQLNPSLVDANTSSAVSEYAVGSLNFLLRLSAYAIGLHGDKKGATAKLQEVTQKGIYRATDAKVVLALLEAWKGNPQRAISLFKDVRSAHPRSFMCDLSLAAAYEEAGKDPKMAIRVYQDLLREISSKAPGVQPGEIYFRIGKNYVSLHDNSLALDQFQKAVQESQSNAETKPLAYFEMARIYENRKEKEQAKECYGQAIKYGGSLPLIEKQIEQARKKIS